MKRFISICAIFALIGCGYPSGEFGKHFDTGEKVVFHDITVKGSTMPLTITKWGWDAYWQQYFYDTVDANGQPWTHVINYQLKAYKGN